MSFTRGGPNKCRQFEWHYDPGSRQLLIINQNGREIMYSLGEIQAILQCLQARFGKDYFRLSVKELPPGKEAEPGSFSQTILDVLPDDFARCQGASYLGVVLEECGCLEWNGQSVGIAWRLTGGVGVEDVGKRLVGG